MGRKQAADSGQQKLAFFSPTLPADSQRPAAPAAPALSAASQEKSAERVKAAKAKAAAKVSTRTDSVQTAKAKAKARTKATAKAQAKVKAKAKAKAKAKLRAKAQAKAKAQAQAKATGKSAAEVPRTTAPEAKVPEGEQGSEAVRETRTQPFAETGQDAEREPEVTPEGSAGTAEVAEESEEEGHAAQDEVVSADESELAGASSEDSQRTLELPGASAAAAALARSFSSAVSQAPEQNSGANPALSEGGFETHCHKLFPVPADAPNLPRSFELQQQSSPSSASQAEQQPPVSPEDAANGRQEDPADIQRNADQSEQMVQVAPCEASAATAKMFCPTSEQTSEILGHESAARDPAASQEDEGGALVACESRSGSGVGAESPKMFEEDELAQASALRESAAGDPTASQEDETGAPVASDSKPPKNNSRSGPGVHVDSPKMLEEDEPAQELAVALHESAAGDPAASQENESGALVATDSKRERPEQAPENRNRPGPGVGVESPEMLEGVEPAEKLIVLHESAAGDPAASQEDESGALVASDSKRERPEQAPENRSRSGPRVGVESPEMLEGVEPAEKPSVLNESAAGDPAASQEEESGVLVASDSGVGGESLEVPQEDKPVEHKLSPETPSSPSTKKRLPSSHTTATASESLVGAAGIDSQGSKRKSPGSPAASPSSEPETPPLTRRKLNQQADAATEAILSMAQEMKDKAAEWLDKQQESFFAKIKAACERHPQFFPWKAAVEDEIGQHELPPDERWIVWEQEPYEDLESFLEHLQGLNGRPKDAAANTVPSESEDSEDSAGAKILRCLAPSRQSCEASDSSDADIDPADTSDTYELQEPEGFEGSLMWRYLKQAWAQLTKDQKRHVHHSITKTSHMCSRHPTVATFCSGSGMAELAHRCLTASLKASETLLFSCEKENWKAKHLQQSVHPRLSASREHLRLPASSAAESEPCLFSDMCEVVSGEGACVVHNKRCKLETEACPTVLMVGYSCKTLSKLTPANKDKEFALRTGTGSSGETAQALLVYLRDWRPSVAILENVDEMAKDADESDNVRYFLSELDNLGYVFATKMLDSSDFGMAANRRRAWQVVLNRGSFNCGEKELNDVAQSVMKLARELAVGSWPLEDFLLDFDDPLVQQELQRREDKSPASRGLLEGWRAKHREFFQNKGIAWTALRIPEEVKLSPWFKFLTEREREILAWGILFAEQKQAAAKHSAASQESKYLAVDVSQRLDRCRISCDRTLFTVLPTQKVGRLR